MNSAHRTNEPNSFDASELLARTQNSYDCRVTEKPAEKFRFEYLRRCGCERMIGHCTMDTPRPGCVTLGLAGLRVPFGKSSKLANTIERDHERRHWGNASFAANQFLPISVIGAAGSSIARDLQKSCKTQYSGRLCKSYREFALNSVEDIMQNMAAAVGTLLFVKSISVTVSWAHETRTSLRAQPIELAQSCDLHTCRQNLDTWFEQCQTSLGQSNPPDPAQRETYRKCVADGREQFQQCFQVTCPNESTGRLVSIQTSPKRVRSGNRGAVSRPVFRVQGVEYRSADAADATGLDAASTSCSAGILI